MSNYLVGRTIVSVRRMTDAERAGEHWKDTAIVVILDDGTKLYPARDYDRTGPGALVGERDGRPIRFM